MYPCLVSDLPRRPERLQILSSACLCLSIAGIKGVCHYISFNWNFLVLKSYFMVEYLSQQETSIRLFLLTKRQVLFRFDWFSHLRFSVGSSFPFILMSAELYLFCGTVFAFISYLHTVQKIWEQTFEECPFLWSCPKVADLEKSIISKNISTSLCRFYWPWGVAFIFG